MASGCLGLVLAGCQQQNPGAGAGSNASIPAMASTNAPSPVRGWSPTNAQPRLSTLKLYLGSEVVTAELAMTKPQVMTGMMFRKEMPENEGMLFVFGVPHRAAFYMRNTTVPLTAAYIDSEGTILELHDLQPLKEEAVEAATDNVQYVLEMNQGWFQRHHVGVGAILTTEIGQFKETFGFRHQ